MWIGAIYSDLDFDTDTVKAEDQDTDHWTGAYRIMRCIRLKTLCPYLSTVLSDVIRFRNEEYFGFSTS